MAQVQGAEQKIVLDRLIEKEAAPRRAIAAKPRATRGETSSPATRIGPRRC